MVLSVQLYVRGAHNMTYIYSHITCAISQRRDCARVNAARARGNLHAARYDVNAARTNSLTRSERSRARVSTKHISRVSGVCGVTCGGSVYGFFGALRAVPLRDGDTFLPKSKIYRPDRTHELSR